LSIRKKGLSFLTKPESGSKSFKPRDFTDFLTKAQAKAAHCHAVASETHQLIEYMSLLEDQQKLSMETIPIPESEPAADPPATGNNNPQKPVREPTPIESKPHKFDPAPEQPKQQIRREIEHIDTPEYEEHWVALAPVPTPKPQFSRMITVHYLTRDATQKAIAELLDSVCGTKNLTIHIIEADEVRRTSKQAIIDCRNTVRRM